MLREGDVRCRRIGGPRALRHPDRRLNAVADAAKAYAVKGLLGDIYYAETAYVRCRGIPRYGVFHMKKHNAGGPVDDLGVTRSTCSSI